MQADSRSARDVRRRRLDVRGQVQGVGFRPYVYRLAMRHGLRGQVANDATGAVIEVEGEADALAAFERALVAELPPLARIARLDATEVAPRGDLRFEISDSRSDSADSLSAARRPEVTPDAAVCAECLRELFDPADRRFGYPFINCTNCGPRYSIIRDVPYDRPLTTMAVFAMCPRCEAEYRDPANRRFHAQPNACAACGPSVRLALPASSADAETGAAAIRAAAARLLAGQVVAVKGIGGYHLACRADREDVVARLRERKLRDGKPLAIMAPSLDAARRLCRLTSADEAALASPAAPIVLAPRAAADAGLDVAPSVAPGCRDLGVMLPYTPLHHLLFSEGLPPLVMTSANLAGQPLTYRDDDALSELGDVADAFLMHDREIVRPIDDSVVFTFRDAVIPIRRARGYAPQPMIENPPAAPSIGGRGAESGPSPLLGGTTGGSKRDMRGSAAFAGLDPPPAPSLEGMGGENPPPTPSLGGRGAGAGAHGPVEGARVLAVGGELKCTVCLFDGREAILSEHLGDVTRADTYRHVVDAIGRLRQLFAFDPDVVACDLHPSYLTSTYARSLGLPLVEVQHHHAHIASVMAEHGEHGPLIGLACDGTGYGPDGAVWGCEVLRCERGDYRRLAHLDYFPLVGGDRAAIETWRPAAALLFGRGPGPEGSRGRGAEGRRGEGAEGRRGGGAKGPRGGGSEQSRAEDGAIWESLFERVGAQAWRAFLQQMRAGVNAPPTSSLGRVFDAAAFVLGLCDCNRHEAEAAMALEAAAADVDSVEPLPYELQESTMSLAPTIAALAKGRLGGEPVAVLAARFHESVAQMMCAMAQMWCRRERIDAVAFSGGCFANRRLLTRVAELLEAAGLRALHNRSVPTGDGGLSLGQAYVAAYSTQSAGAAK